MAAITGRWTLTETSNTAALAEAMNSTPEYKAKLNEYVEGLKTGDVKLEFDYVLDRAAGTLQYAVFVNGQLVNERKLVKSGVETDNVFDDGRPTKLKIIIDSDSKFRGWETFDGFTLSYTVEATADHLTAVNEANGQTSVWTFRRS